ncbi:MAG: tetratricopeptide repeat protein [Myxococcaceae bacterium]
MIALTLALALAQFTPQEAQAIFVEGNDAYYKGEYDNAEARYQKLIDAGLGGPDVYFNLGTCHLAQGHLGPAILWLERAARLADDDDINANLAMARQRQVDQVIGAEATTIPFTQRVADSIDERLVSIAFLATWWLGFVLVWLAWRRETARVLVGLLAAALLVVGGVLGAALAITAHVHATVEEAIVMPESARVREFPGDTARVSFEVHAGLKVRIMEVSGRYARVRLPNALEGWTERESVETL